MDTAEICFLSHLQEMLTAAGGKGTPVATAAPGSDVEGSVSGTGAIIAVSGDLKKVR